MSNKPKIGVDIDGVLCDIMPSIVGRINKKYGVEWTVEQIDRWNYARGGIRIDAEIKQAFLEPGFIAELPVAPSGPAVIKRLRKKFSFKVVSARYPHSLGESINWLKTKYALTQYVFTNDKSLADVNVLIEDSPFYARKFVGEQNGKIVLLYDRPWNNAEAYPFLEDMYYEGCLERIKGGWPNVEKRLKEFL